MDGLLDWLSESWQFLSRDVSLVGGFQSPMLSWLGSGVIIALCLWHSLYLVRGVLQIRQAFMRFHSTAARLVRARQQASNEWIATPALAKKQAQIAQAPGARRDLDDLQELDHVMRSEQTFAGDWLSYRKTIAVEQPSWFIEPTVHTERSAAEFFNFETLCSTYLNVRFYQHLPSFMTGVGLMFTFLAILVGLSKLHANGSQIEGIQGLINGLSGKFVTSIVGLACANVFMMLEKSLWYRLAKHHRLFVSLLDEMFPQRVKDQSAQNRSISNGVSTSIGGTARNDSANQMVETVQQRLGSTVAALTTVSQSLAALGAKNGLLKREELASDIGKEVQKALRPLLDPLLEAIRDLNHSVEKQHCPAQLSHAEMDRMFNQLSNHLDGGRLVVGTTTTSRQGKASGRWSLMESIGLETQSTRQGENRMKAVFAQETPESSSALSSGIADLMTSLAVIFILLLAAHVTRVEEGTASPTNLQRTVTAELTHQLQPLHLTVETKSSDPRVLSVVVPDAILNFEFGKSTLLPPADAFLTKTMPHYAAMICGPQGHEVESFVIEGYTDDQGDDIRNLKLSQDRSFAVLVKGLEVIRTRLPWAYECFQQKASASGRGRQDLLRNAAGYLDRDKSRRVIFKIHLQHP